MESETQYLVTPGEESDVTVAVCGGRNEEKNGELFFLTSHEAAVRFDPESGAAFSVGQPVTVSLCCDRLGDTICIPGTVNFRRDEDHRRLFRIPFVFEGSDGSNLQRRLGKLNRRKEMRVPPESPEAVKVEIRPAVIAMPGSEPTEAPRPWISQSLEMHDMSFHGLSIMASFETDLVLAETEHVEVRMTFPDPTPSATVVGFIRNRILDGARIRYGVEIMAQYTHDWLVQEDTLAQYVWSRMRELFGIRAS